MGGIFNPLSFSRASMRLVGRGSRLVSSKALRNDLEAVGEIRLRGCRHRHRQAVPRYALSERPSSAANNPRSHGTGGCRARAIAGAQAILELAERAELIEPAVNVLAGADTAGPSRRHKSQRRIDRYLPGAGTVHASQQSSASNSDCVTGGPRNSNISRNDGAYLRRVEK